MAGSTSTLQTANVQPRGLQKPGNMIKGFTPTLQELGKIKIGSKGEPRTNSNGKQYRLPTKQDFFTITTMARGKDGLLLEDTGVMTAAGDRPKQLNITLLYNDPYKNFYTTYAMYAAGKRACYGDGETAVTSEGEVKTCNPSECPIYQDGDCKPNGILSVILTDTPQLGGVYKFRTTSYNTIKNILSSMSLLHNRTGGLLAGIPLSLTVSPQTVKTAGGKSVTIHTVNIEFQGTNEDLAEATERARESDQRMKGLKPAITQLENESEEEMKDVQEEFYPPTLEEIED